MSPWLFHIFMDGYIREIKVKMGNLGARLKMYGMWWAMVAC